MRLCDIADCGRKHHALGLCGTHWYRQHKYGDTTTVLRSHKFAEIDPARRLRERSERRGDCIVYTWRKPSRSGHRQMGFRGKSVTVHRIAWTLAHGEIPDGQCVLHRCDVPDCINVKHLFLGTQGDNTRDRDAKGRHRSLPGSTNGYAKLSEYQVLEIRRLSAEGVPQRRIARRFHVTQGCISLVVRRVTWTHVKAA